MKKHFLSFDILSPYPQVYYLGNTRYNNNCGAIISIITSLVIIAFFTYFLICFIEGSNASIYSYFEPIYSSEYDVSNRQIRYKLVNEQNLEIDSRIVQIVPFISSITNNTHEEHTLLSIFKCDINDLLTRNKNYLTNAKDASNPSYKSNFTCISGGVNSYAKLSFNNSFQSYITTYVTKCMNSTKNNNNCLSSDEIDIYLIKNKIYLLMYIENIWVNHTQKEPFIKSYSMRKIEVDMSFYYKYYYSFQEVKYSSDNGVIIKNPKTKKMFLFDNNNNFNSNNQNNVGNYRIGLTTVDTLYPNSLMETVFSLNREFTLSYVRVYSKLQGTFANTGGFSFITWAIGKFIVYIFTNGRMFVEILTIRNKLELKRREIMLKDKESNKSGDTNTSLNQGAININIIDPKVRGLSSDNLNSNSLLGAQTQNESTIKIINSKSNNNNNNSVSLGLVSYTKYSKEKELAKIQDKLKEKKNDKNKSSTKKNISYFDSFVYFFTCVKVSSIRCNFIRYCELAVKSKLSCDDLIYKLKDLDFLINSNINDTKPLSVLPEVNEEHDDEKSNLIDIKEPSEYSIDNKIESIRFVKNDNSNVDTKNINNNEQNEI